MDRLPTLDPDPSRPDAWRASGDWVLEHAQRVKDPDPGATDGRTRIDGRGIERLDASGAMLLWRIAKRAGIEPDALQLREEHQPIYQAVCKACSDPPVAAIHSHWLHTVLARIGAAVLDNGREILALIAFGGQTLLTALRIAPHPKRWRKTSILVHMEAVGVDAAPLVMLLAFLVGAVVAFLSSEILAHFGAQLFVVELIGISFLRELGVLLAAILLAGRTASAYTAQIGTMQSGEEIDAMRTLGLDPIELLVLPRIIALLLMLPLLAFLAMLAGIAGGMTVAATLLGIAPELFLSRLQDTVDVQHFLVGLSKAPVFAILIGLIGCLEGLQARGSAQSVGERTTSSVVQSIALVILANALAALWFMEMGW